MAVYKSNISITDEFTGIPGGGVENLQGGVMGRHVATLDFYAYLAYENLTLEFNAAEKTIYNCNQIDFRSFLDDDQRIGQGLAPGRLITIEDSVSNNTTYTIVSVTDRLITIAETPVNEVVSGAKIFDDTPVECIDFYYNLIENKDEESFLSLTDRGAIQRFKRSGVDATILTPANMIVSSASFGWVTNTITNPVTGETSEVTIQGDGITDHKQYFKIIQTFHIAPFATNAQVENIREGVSPEYFEDAQSLKYTWRIDASFECCGFTAPHRGDFIEPLGCSNWFDQNNRRSRPDYYIESVVFSEGESIDINIATDCVITLKSRAGVFVDNLTKIVLDFLYLPLNESRYINTPNTILRENFINDRRMIVLNTINNGEFFGTDYQVLTDVNPLFVDANTIEVHFTTVFSTALKTFFQSISIDNRNFAFVVTTQDQTITTTLQCDRVPAISSIYQIAWNKEDDTLLTAVDNLHVLPLPYNPGDSCCDPDPNSLSTSIAGYEGDTFVATFPFRVKSTEVDGVTPTIINAGMQVVAVKDGKENFVVEERIFDSTFVRKLNGVQTIEFEESVKWNNLLGTVRVCKFNNNPSFDEVDKAGFSFDYPLTLRYDFWAALVPTQERNQYQIFEDIPNPTNAWNTLQQQGWTLKLRFVANVQGYTDYVNTFEHYWDIDAKYLGQEPDSGTIFESETTYTTEDKVLVNGIQEGEKTIITTTYTGDFSTLPAGMESFYAYIFADLETIGGVNFRRFAITEFNIGDTDTPFKATQFDGLADNTWASENLRISIFGTEKIVVETIYDDTIDNWGAAGGTIIIYPRLGFMNNNCFLIDSVGKYVLNAKGNRIKINCDCESEETLPYYRKAIT